MFKTIKQVLRNIGNDNHLDFGSKILCDHKWEIMDTSYKKKVFDDGTEIWVKDKLVLHCKKCGKMK